MSYISSCTDLYLLPKKSNAECDCKCSFLNQWNLTSDNRTNVSLLRLTVEESTIDTSRQDDESVTATTAITAITAITSGRQWRKMNDCRTIPMRMKEVMFVFIVFSCFWNLVIDGFQTINPKIRTVITASKSATVFSVATSQVTTSLAVSAVNGEMDTSTIPQMGSAISTGIRSTTSEDSNNNNKNNSFKKIRLNVNERARTVTSVCTSGTLCTLSTEAGIEGAPFGSFVDYVLDDEGCPILLMNDMSMHTINIQKQIQQSGHANVTLFTQLGTLNTNNNNDNNKGGAGLQDVSRCSLTGELVKIEDPASEPQMAAIRMKYSLTHSSYADQVMDSPKFAFYRLLPKKVYFVGGFGVSSQWVDPDAYRTAAPDMLANVAASIVERVNRDHADDLYYTARYVLGISSEIESVRMTNMDRLGMDVRVTFHQPRSLSSSSSSSRRNTKLRTDEFRIGFRINVLSVEDAKSELLKIFQEAWEMGNGLSWDNYGIDTDDDDEIMDKNNDNNARGILPKQSTIDDNIPVLKIAADSLE